MATLLNSYSETNCTTYSSTFSYRSPIAVGQSFSLTADANLTSAKFYICKHDSNTTGTIHAKLFAHTGTYGTNSMGTGDPLATSDAVDASTLSTAPTFSLTTFTFSGDQQYALSSINYYVIVLWCTDISANDYVEVGVDDSSPSHSGNYIQYYTTWSPGNTMDVSFYVYGDLSETTTTSSSSYTTSSSTNTDTTSSSSSSSESTSSSSQTTSSSSQTTSSSSSSYTTSSSSQTTSSSSSSSQTTSSSSSSSQTTSSSSQTSSSSSSSTVSTSSTSNSEITSTSSSSSTSETTSSSSSSSISETTSSSSSQSTSSSSITSTTNSDTTSSSSSSTQSISTSSTLSPEQGIWSDYSDPVQGFGYTDDSVKKIIEKANALTNDRKDKILTEDEKVDIVNDGYQIANNRLEKTDPKRFLKKGYADVKNSYETGSASVSVGSTIVTGTDTVWDSSWTGKRIVFGDEGFPYQVYSVDHTLQLTLTRAYSGTASLSGETYKIFQDEYDIYDESTGLAVADLKKIERVIDEDGNRIDEYDFNRDEGGYFIKREDDNLKFCLNYTVATTESEGRWTIWYSYQPPKLDSMADEPEFPKGYSSVLVSYLCSKIEERKGDTTKASYYMGEFMNMVNKMIGQASPRTNEKKGFRLDRNLNQSGDDADWAEDIRSRKTITGTIFS